MTTHNTNHITTDLHADMHYILLHS